MKKSASRRPVLAAAPETLAERGGEALRQGRFKEATEIFKQLARQDSRPEWTERLHDAYAGRAHALADKGMFKEAAMVLENTLVPDGTLREPLLYLACLIRQGQPQKAREFALKAIARPAGMDTARLVDFAAALSIAAPAPTPEAKPPGGTGFAAQSRTAQAALHAWLQGSPPSDIDALLGTIPLRSPFGPIRLVLKSLITPPDAVAKARSLLAMVPATSAFIPLRDAADAALADDSDALIARWPDLRPAQQRFVGEVRGLPEGGAALLAQILDAERRGPAALFSLLTRAGLPLPAETLRTACLNLLPALPDRLPQFRQQFGPLSTLEHNRVLGLATEANDDWQHAWLYWQGVVATLEEDATPEGRLAQAVVLRHMAEMARTHPMLIDRVAKPGEDPVATHLERSIAVDPDYLPATLALLERYRSSDVPKDWHRAADEATERFPNNPIVLLHAVDAAVARSAYKKAVGLAHRLLAVDPINLPVRQRMVELQLAHARKQFRSGRADLAGRTLGEAAEWERPETPNPALRIGRALVAMTAESGEDAVRAAVRDAGGGTPGWFRALVEATLMGLPDQRLKLVQGELDAATKDGSTRETILELVALLSQKEIRESRRVLAPVLRRIHPFLAKGSEIAWTPAEFQTIAELLVHLQDHATLLHYAQDAARRDPKDHAARFYQILARSEGKTERLTVMQEDDLHDLLEEAGAREDFSMFNRVQRLLFGSDTNRVKYRRSMDEPLPDEDDEFDENDVLEVMAAIGGRKGPLQAGPVRALVRDMGRDMTIEMLTATLADPAGEDVLSEDFARRLSTALVDKALRDPPERDRPQKDRRQKNRPQAGRRR